MGDNKRENDREREREERDREVVTLILAKIVN